MKKIGLFATGKKMDAILGDSKKDRELCTNSAV